MICADHISLDEGTTMLSRASLSVLLLALLGAPVPGFDADPEPTPKKLTKDDIARAEKAVKDHLEKIKGAYGMVKLIEDGPTARALPGHAFFHVLYRQYPVARIPPAGLRPSNVVTVGRDGKVIVMTTSKDLEKFVKARAPSYQGKEKLLDAARAWVRLTQEFHQDGFFKFSLIDSDTKVSPARDGHRVEARTIVMAGGNGALKVELNFDDKGRLSSVNETAMIRAGPRPICQATKLLDADAVVRKMAERDLLIMGRPAKYYLDEQRARANPELRRAIDQIWKRICEQEP